jgi:hypothetical protein
MFRGFAGQTKPGLLTFQLQALGMCIDYRRLESILARRLWSFPGHHPINARKQCFMRRWVCTIYGMQILGSYRSNRHGEYCIVFCVDTHVEFASIIEPQPVQPATMTAGIYVMSRIQV